MDFIPEENSTYQDREYWEKRFTDEEAYDWLTHEFDSLRSVLEPVLDGPEDSEILHLG
jgi:hypothetical protein